MFSFLKKKSSKLQFRLVKVGDKYGVQVYHCGDYVYLGIRKPHLRWHSHKYVNEYCLSSYSEARKLLDKIYREAKAEADLEYNIDNPEVIITQEVKGTKWS